MIQSLSIVVPGGCPNNCKFCVSHMHSEDYENQIEKNKRFRHLYKEDYFKRLSFARDNGCNSAVITGNGEPLANQNFIEFFAEQNSRLDKPFRKIELQTSGVFIDEGVLRWLRNTVGVSTISVSVSDLFDDHHNVEIMGTPAGLRYTLDSLCKLIKVYDFNLRLSLNISDWVNKFSIKEVFQKLNDLCVDQVTFRKLYISGNDTPEDEWIDSHKPNANCPWEYWEALKGFTISKGKPLERLPFGAMKYSVNGISTVVDTDCMATSEGSETLKYLILRENCKLYSRWDDKGSLIF